MLRVTDYLLLVTHYLLLITSSPMNNSIPTIAKTRMQKQLSMTTFPNLDKVERTDLTSV